MRVQSAVFVFVGLVLLPAAFGLASDQADITIPTLPGPRKIGPFPELPSFLCGAKVPFGKGSVDFAQVKCESDADCFKCGGGLFKCESCQTCCGGEKKCTSKQLNIVCPPPPPCAPPPLGFDPCGGPPPPRTPCTKDSQCTGLTTCKGCPSCNGEPFRGTCLPPNIVFACAACAQKCTKDDQCPGTDKCMGCVCDGPFVGTCMRSDIFLACDCPEVLPAKPALCSGDGCP